MSGICSAHQGHDPTCPRCCVDTSTFFGMNVSLTPSPSNCPTCDVPLVPPIWCCPTCGWDGPRIEPGPGVLDVIAVTTGYRQGCLPTCVCSYCGPVRAAEERVRAATLEEVAAVTSAARALLRSLVVGVGEVGMRGLWCSSKDGHADWAGLALALRDAVVKIDATDLPLTYQEREAGRAKSGVR